jgi:hypothetical protein
MSFISSVSLSYSHLYRDPLLLAMAENYSRASKPTRHLSRHPGFKYAKDPSSPFIMAFLYFSGWGRILAPLAIIVLILAFPGGVQSFQSPPYQAPLINTDFDPEFIIPGGYLVYLIRGYSLEDHIATVGEQLRSHIRREGQEWKPGCIFYAGWNVGEELLTGIRSDRGVDYVELLGTFLPTVTKSLD